MREPTIELREIRVFLTLAQVLHFGRTAERLGLTQSRVSQILRELERKLGVQLLHRTSRRVALTPRGERFQTEVAPVYARLTDIVERAAAPRPTGAVRLGFMYPNTGGERLVKVIDAFESAYPGCDVMVTTTPHDDPGQPLRSGEIDLLVTALLRDPPTSVATVTLGTEPRVLAVASSHPLARRTQVSLEDIADYKVAAPSILPDDLQEAWVPFQTPSGRPIERLARRPQTDNELAMLVALGKIVHPSVPSTVSHFGPPNIVLVPIEDMPPLRVVLLALPGAKPPQVREFLRLARDVVAAA